MKEIWKKTSLLYKMIAVLLTVVMVGTTLYFHFDKKYVAKAMEDSEWKSAIAVKKMFLENGKNGENESDWKEVTESVDRSKINEGDKFAYFIYINTSEEWHNISYNVTSVANVSKDNAKFYNKVVVVDVVLPQQNILSLKDIEVESRRHISLSDIEVIPFYSYQPQALTATAKIGETDITNNSFDCNSDKTINVHAESTWKINSLKVLDKTLTDEEVTSSVGFDPTTHLYTLNYTYSFDQLTGNSEFTDNFKVVVGDENLDTAKNKVEIKGTKLLFDQTKPTISVGSIDLNKWHNENSISFEIKSGNGEKESDIETVTAKVNGNDKTVTNDTGDTYKISDLDDGIKEIVITATDKAGNANESDSGRFTYKVDKSLPNITSINVEPVNEVGEKKYVKLNDQSNVIISGNVTDTYSGANYLKIVTTKPDGGEVSDINNTARATRDSNTGEFPQSWDYRFELSKAIGTQGTTVMPEEIYDGDFTVVVCPVDAAGNECSVAMTTKFTLDTINPKITTSDIIVQRHRITGPSEENDPNYWENVPASEIDSNGKYLVNKALFNRVRYQVKVTDLNFYNVKFMLGEEIKDQFDSIQTNDLYYYEVPIGSIGSDELAYKAVATDLALNETKVDLPILQEINSDLTVNLVSITYNGQVIASDKESVTDLSSYFSDNSNYNGIYTVTVNVTSGYEVDKINMLKNGEEYKAFSRANESAKITNTPDSVTGVFKTNDITFILPKIGTDNELLRSMKIYVEDTDATPRTVTIDLGDLLYDRSQPIVVNKSSLDTNKWYQDYTLNYELKSGESAVESILTSASYAIDGGAASSIDVSAAVKSKTGAVDVPESKTTAGTKIVFDAKDKATNTIDTASVNYPNSITVKVDKTAPKVDGIKVNGESVSEENIIAGNPQLTSAITDNLTVKDYSVTVKYNDEAYAIYPVSVEKDASEEAINHTLQQLLGSKELKDGKYTVSVSARDKSERTSNVSSTSFIVDNTVPVLGASIISGTTGKNNGYYNTDVVVRLTCKDNNFNPSAMTVTDNGSAINANWQVGNDIYYADVTLSSEGLHDIRVTGNDKAGTAAEAKQVTFIIDKTVPTVSLLVNGGQVYNESRGTLNLTGPLTLTASVSDKNEDAGDLRVQIVKTVPDTATSTSEFLPTGERTFSFADEADYVVNIFAVDRANNQGPTRTISFRVDTTAPQLTITGANGGTASSATSVSFNITEAFWSDAKGTVEIYRKAGDGVDEALYKTLTISPTQRAYSLSELLRESGIYRFEFTADDKVGHTATASQKITVDVNKPEITLSGVNNYDSTDGAVSISAIIKDEFYASKKVSIQGTRTDAAGKKTALSFSPFAATANPTTINDTFSEEGIYDITLTATDIAGNVTSNSVHFTIDTSKPVIGDLSKYDGKTFNAKTFEELGLDINLDEIVTDLTVCQVRMYLNGSEYDGMADIEDGSYTLLITAEDELGHKSEKSATFVLDTKEPIFIVTGVEDGEIRNDNYNIEVSLQLDEDTLDEVKLNDKVITVKNNVATFDVTDKGEYELYMKATDEAGNEASQTIKFTFGEESVATAVSNAVEKAASHWWLWAIVVAAILAVCGIIFFILKRRNEE